MHSTYSTEYLSKATILTMIEHGYELVDETPDDAVNPIMVLVNYDVDFGSDDDERIGMIIAAQF